MNQAKCQYASSSLTTRPDNKVLIPERICALLWGMSKRVALSLQAATRREFLHAAALCAMAGIGRPLQALAGAGSGYQLGCYTRPWDQFDYRVALDGIAEAGFKYAGIMTAKGKSWVVITVDSTPEEVAAIAGEVKQRGLKTLSIYGGDFPVAKSVEAGAAGLRRLIDDCVLCSCPNLLLGGTTDPKLVGPYYEVVAQCCDYAASRGVGLSIKPHGGQNATGPQCRKLIEQVGHKNFRLWYDPGNIFYYSEGKLDPVADSATVDGLVVGMSVKDFKPPKEVEVTPGTGQVNFRQVLAHLNKGGFRSGPMIVECLARGDTPSKVTAEAKKARQFLEELTGL
ncbi:MAG: sugar phosphate isomerase/epimerase family protein [Verrucomicrobiota bacterium]|jgi:sugar phosphate isomerase/epimerase